MINKHTILAITWHIKGRRAKLICKIHFLFRLVIMMRHQFRQFPHFSWIILKMGALDSGRLVWFKLDWFRISVIKRRARLVLSVVFLVPAKAFKSVLRINEDPIYVVVI